MARRSTAIDCHPGPQLAEKGLRWLAYDRYTQNALEPGSRFHSSLADAVAPGTALPTADSLLFGRAAQVRLTARRRMRSHGPPTRPNLANAGQMDVCGLPGPR